MKLPDEIEPIEYVWRDRKRIFGLPLSMTRYLLSADRLFMETGFFTLHSEEIELYRLQDLQLRINLIQRIFRVGSLRILSTDKTMPRLVLQDIARPREVKELIHAYAEEAKLRRRVRLMEVLGEETDNLEIPEDPEDPEEADASSGAES